MEFTPSEPKSLGPRHVSRIRMTSLPSSNRGSGLIVTLSVLALLALMATMFITLMRTDLRVAANYADDQRCQMLAWGMLNYLKAILRDDLDRTWGKYENRDRGVGYVTNLNSTDGTRVLGLNTLRYGTPISNDFWFSEPTVGGWGGLSANGPRYWAGNSFKQQSFGCSWSRSPVRRGVAGRIWDTKNNREFDAWLSRQQCRFDDEGMIVHYDHPRAVGEIIDFDASGEIGSSDEKSLLKLYHDKGPFVLYSGDSYFFPGASLTGEVSLPGNVHWRWAVKMGVSHAARINLNTVGNLDGRNTSLLNDVGNLSSVFGHPSLVGKRAVDEADLLWQDRSRHLGRIQWKGFSGEYEFQDGFPRFYNEVNYLPSQVNLEKLFRRSRYSGVTTTPYEDAQVNLLMDPAMAHPLIEYRLGDDGKPGAPGEHERYMPGWRRDGATFYRLQSMENPQGDDRFFGSNEAIEHARPVYHGGTSAIVNALGDDKETRKETWRKLRPFATVWSTDTILRGKVWPTEGWLPWRRSGTPGDWRHIDILKRVNINLIGASGNDGLGDKDLKRKWLDKRARERQRLYYMLVAGMRFGDSGMNVSEHRLRACQFIAALSDMVDRDNEETYFSAKIHAEDPNAGTSAWGLGTERHAVINEVVVYVSQANNANWQASKLRIELYNPMENIPWIPDADEVIDISDYRLKINDHVYVLGHNLKEFGVCDFDIIKGSAKTIGADGIYGRPVINWRSGNGPHATWTRYLHIGWERGWPSDISKEELTSGLRISLWKPLSGAAAANVPIRPNRVEMLKNAKCVSIDDTGMLKYLPAFSSGGPGSPRSHTTPAAIGAGTR